MPRFFLYILLNCLAGAVMGQSQQHYLFSNISSRSGLASNHAGYMAQDDQGYIWIATINGLQRYDGTRFVTFRHNPADSNSIPGNHIRFIYFDKNKRLWINVDNGRMGQFDTRKFIFHETKLVVPDDNMALGDRSLVEDAAGNLFLFFNFHLVSTYNLANNQFSVANNLFPTPPGWKITGLHCDTATGKYWMGFDSGLCVYNPRTRHLNYQHHNPDKEQAIEDLTDRNGMYGLLVDSKQRLWYCTWPAGSGSLVHCYDLRKKQKLLSNFSLDTTFKNYHEPRFFTEQKNGTIWVYGTGMLGQFDEKANVFINTGKDIDLKNSLVNDRIDCLYEDRENNLWICTHNNGIYQFNPSAQLFKSFGHPNPVDNLPGNGAVMSFIELADKSFLYGTWGEGIFRCDSNYKPVPLHIKGIPEKNMLTAWDMCKTADGKIWMGLQDGYLLIYDPATASARQYKPAIFDSRTIRQVVTDHQGNIWFGTQSKGLFKYVAGNSDLEKGISWMPTVPLTLTEKLYVDPQGNLWVCTIVNGVYKINPRNGAVLAHYTDKGPEGKRLLYRSAADVIQYDDTTVVIAAGGLNILNTKTNTFTYISPANGLPSNMINAIEKDDEGELWVSFQIGICRVNLQHRTISFFDRSDGIANDNFNLAASCRLSNGSILFGSGNDFTVLRPKDFKLKTVPNDVTITGFTLSNRPLPTDSILRLQKIDLQHNDNSVVIYFASLSYLQSSKITYYYMLEGLDKNWINAGSGRQAIYSHLPPGNYTFRVKCQNADGATNKNITQLNFTVSTPFWKAWWFYSLLLLVGIAVLFWLDKERMQRKASLQSMRSDIAGNLHEEVNMALHNINILSEMAKIKAGVDPQKSKEYIEQIHNKSNSMILALEDMLWSLSPDNDSMQKTVERMKEYIDELKQNHGVHITMLVDQKVAALELNMKLRHEAFLVFKEGIKNLVQSGTRQCDIQIGLSKNNLLFTMQFHTASCNMQQLQQLLRRYDLEKHLQTIGATLDVQVHKTNSILVLHVPAD